MTAPGASAAGIRFALQTILRSRILGQVAVFTISNVLASLIGAGIKVVLAKRLSVEEFGSYAFASSFLTFVALFFEFGLFLPAARVAAQAGGPDRRQLIGAALLVYLPVGLGFSAFLFASSFVVDRAFHVHVAGALQVSALLSFGYPFTVAGLLLAQGVDKLHAASLTSAAGQVLFALTLVAAILIEGRATVETAVVLRAATTLVAAAWLAAWLRPKFRGATAHVRGLVRAARDYGFHVYVGRVLGIGTYNMDVLMLAALSNARQVAVYTLAGAVAGAVGLPVVGLSNALFGRMVRLGALNTRWLGISWLVGLAGSAAAWLGGSLLLSSFFSHAYQPAVALIPVLGLAQTIRGVTSVYNSFLSAQALGRDLRMAATVLTISNLLLNFALIPPFAATGAAWASVLALAANLLAHAIAYRRYGRRGGLDGGTPFHDRPS